MSSSLSVLFSRPSNRNSVVFHGVARCLLQIPAILCRKPIIEEIFVSNRITGEQNAQFALEKNRENVIETVLCSNSLVRDDPVRIMEHPVYTYIMLGQ